MLGINKNVSPLNFKHTIRNTKIKPTSITAMKTSSYANCYTQSIALQTLRLNPYILHSNMDRIHAASAKIWACSRKLMYIANVACGVSIHLGSSSEEVQDYPKSPSYMRPSCI